MNYATLATSLFVVGVFGQIQAVEKHVDIDKIAEIERQAKFEDERLRSIISDILIDYMKKHGIALSELARRLGLSSSHVEKILGGQANVTLSTLAHIIALTGTPPQDIFKKGDK